MHRHTDVAKEGPSRRKRFKANTDLNKSLLATNWHQGAPGRRPRKARLASRRDKQLRGILCRLRFSCGPEHGAPKPLQRNFRSFHLNCYKLFMLKRLLFTRYHSHTPTMNTQILITPPPKAQEQTKLELTLQYVLFILRLCFVWIGALLENPYFTCLTLRPLRRLRALLPQAAPRPPVAGSWLLAFGAHTRTIQARHMVRGLRVSGGLGFEMRLS